MEVKYVTTSFLKFLEKAKLKLERILHTLESYNDTEV
jgi:hypothetical protein